MAEPLSLQTLISYLTPISLTIGVIYYIISLRNQRRNREAALLTSIHSQWTTLIHKNYSEILRWEWEDYDDYREKYGDLQSQEKLETVGGYFEGVGVYVREGLIPIRLVTLFMTNPIVRFHEKFGPIANEERVRHNAPRIGSETEYLYNELMKYIEAHPELKT